MDDALMFFGGFYRSKNQLTDRKTTTFVSLLLIWMWLGTRLNEFPLLLYSPGVRTALRRGNAPRPTDKGWSVCGAETESWCERSFSGGRRLMLKRQTLPFPPVPDPKTTATTTTRSSGPSRHRDPTEVFAFVDCKSRCTHLQRERVHEGLLMLL